MPPIVTAVGAIASTTIGSLLLKTAAGVGLGALLNALAPKPETASADDMPGGISLKLKLGAKVPRTVPFGKCKDEGHLVYFNLYGNKSKFLQLVYVLADTLCEGPYEVMIDGKRRTLVPTTNAGGATATYRIDGYASLITVRWFNGAENQAADTELVSKANPEGRWTSNHRLQGMAYLSLTLEWDAEKFQSGVPNFEWIFRGAKLYDWRKDSTNGGSGPHRWSDKSTWQWDDNSAVIRYNYMRGIYNNGERMIGMGLPQSSLIMELFTAAANVCDEPVANPNGTMHGRYRCNVVATDDTRHDNIIQAIDQSMAAGTIERQGRFAPLVGVAYTPVDTLTDEDFVIEESMEYTAKRSRGELINAVFGRFLDDDDNWEMNSYPPVIDTVAEANDGQRLVKDATDFPQVTSPYIAQRLAYIVLNQSRYQATFKGCLGFHKVHLQLGDWITWTSTKYNFTKTFQIVGRRLQNTPRRIFVEMQEVNSAIYSGATVTTPSPSDPIGQVLQASTISGFTPVAETVESEGKQIPAIRFSYTPEDDPTVKAVLFEYRILGGGTAQDAKRIRDDSPLDGDYLEWGGIMPGVDYEARATIVTQPTRATTWTPWTVVSATDAGITYEMLAAEVQSELDKLTGEGTGTLTDTINKLLALEAEVDTKNHVFVQASAPTPTAQLPINEGDLWFDTDDNNAQYVRRSGNWVALPVGGGGGAQTYFQNAPPTLGLITGDLWIDADDGNKLYRWSGAAWVMVRDTGIAANATALLQEVTDRADADGVIYDAINAISSRFGAKANTFYQATAPTIGPAIVVYEGDPFGPVNKNEPLRNGDIWFDSDDSNRMYRYNGSSWVPVPDGTKNKVFYQTEAPPASTVGLAPNDIWIDSDGSTTVVGQPPTPANTWYRWNGTAWILARDQLLDTTWAAVNTEASTRADRDTAIASIVNTVWTEVNNLNAGGYFRLVANNTNKPADVHVRFDLQLRVGAIGGQNMVPPQLGAGGVITQNYNPGSPAFATTGFVLDIVWNGSGYYARAFFDVDRFVIGRGNRASQPFVFDSGTGTLFLNAVKVGSLESLTNNMGLIRTGRILSPDGRIDLDLNTGQFLFWD